MKVWVTKFALTKGVFEEDVEFCEAAEGEETSMVQVVAHAGNSCPSGIYYHGEGKDWHKTEYDAIKRALVMAEKKEKSLRDELKNLDCKVGSLRNRRDQIWKDM